MTRRSLSPHWAWATCAGRRSSAEAAAFRRRWKRATSTRRSNGNAPEATASGPPPRRFFSAATGVPDAFRRPSSRPGTEAPRMRENAAAPTREPFPEAGTTTKRRASTPSLPRRGTPPTAPTSATRSPPFPFPDEFPDQPVGIRHKPDSAFVGHSRNFSLNLHSINYIGRYGSCKILYLVCKCHFLFFHNNSSKLKSGDENNLCICPLFTMSVTER